MAKRSSGGARATKRKHDERAARRRRAKWNEKEWRGKYDALGPVPDDPSRASPWAARALLLVLAETASDPGPPPEQRREQLIRAVAQVAKVIEPAKLTDQIAELEEALEKLRASKVTPRENPPPPEGAPRH